MPALPFYRHDPGNTQHQVEKHNKVLQYQAGLFKRRVVVVGPADVVVDPTQSLVLSGTGTDADKTYDIWSVSFIFDQPEATTEGDEGGAVMSIEGVTQWDDISGIAGSTLAGAIGDVAPEASPSELQAINEGMAAP